MAIPVAALFNPKAKKWINGRKGWYQRLASSIPADADIVWMHCASLGEFEQGRPILEQIRRQYPQYRILVTFFSPSGYEARKNYEGADWVEYLPLDGPSNARRFIETVHPRLVIFVKYEFWYYYLKKLYYREIPLLLVSARFHSGMQFFKWYGKVMRKALSRFYHLFLQDEASLLLLKGIGIDKQCTVAGDSRFDRVVEIAEAGKQFPLVENWINNRHLFVAGSTWPPDETVLAACTGYLERNNIALLLVPHETGEAALAEVEKKFPGAVRYTALSGTAEMNARQSNILILDTVGMLSQLYRYAWVTYVGGGLSRTGVHNVLEAAVFGKPVLFGPNHSAYIEATGLVEAGGGWVIKDSAAIEKLLEQWNANPEVYKQTSEAAAAFVRRYAGATEIIMAFIQENRLLTSASNC